MIKKRCSDQVERKPLSTDASDNMRSGHVGEGGGGNWGKNPMAMKPGVYINNTSKAIFLGA